MTRDPQAGAQGVGNRTRSFRSGSRPSAAAPGRARRGAPGIAGCAAPSPGRRGNRPAAGLSPPLTHTPPPPPAPSPGTPGGSRGFGDAGRPPPRSLPSARGVPPASPGWAARRVAAGARTSPRTRSAGFGEGLGAGKRGAARVRKGRFGGREGPVGLVRFSERSGELAPRNALFVKREAS